MATAFLAHCTVVMDPFHEGCISIPYGGKEVGPTLGRGLHS